MPGMKWGVALLALAAFSAYLETTAVHQGPSARKVLQGVAVPANCSGPADKWTPASIDCHLEEDKFQLNCTYQKESGNALCHIQGPQPQQLIGMTCPVKSGKAVCDLVVAQNFTDPSVVFAIAALLQAWAPSA